MKIRNLKMKSRRKIRTTLTTVIATGIMTHSLGTAQAEEKPLHDRMRHHRSIDAVIWAMPMLNFQKYRDAHFALGAGFNDVTYNSKVQDWKYQTATPNNTTPYIDFFWNIQDGPVVIDIPASVEGIGIFGTFMDAWQRPIDDVGAAGRDKGRGAKYLMVPKGYNGPLLPNAMVYEQRTNNGFAILRPIMAGGATPENLEKATGMAKKIKVYPLSEAGKPAKTKYVDIYGKLMEGTPILDGSIYEKLHSFIQEERVEEQNLAMMGLLARVGIKKGEPFEPSAELKAIYAKAAPEALEYMIEQYHRDLNPWMWEGKKWSKLVPKGVIETDFSYEFPSYFDYHARGSLYYAVISSVKNYGSATFYLDCAETPDGEWLDGGKNYKLVVPANVPVKDFWSITTYDLVTASYLRDIVPSSIDSTMTDVKKNDDGTVTIYFGPTLPKGANKENWLRTDPERRFFLLSRFYGPKPELFDGKFQLNNIERLK